MRSIEVAALLFSLSTSAACASGGRSTPTRNPEPAPAAALLQTLYESGRDDEVVTRVSAMSPGLAREDDLWFAAHSQARLGRRGEAASLFTGLSQTANEPFRVAAQIGLAVLDGNPEAIERARQAAVPFLNNPYVQFELGLAHTTRGDFAAAAMAFDACADTSPRFAYAYYHAGLAYERLNRPDLTVARFETFQRLAPEAPERAQVDSILRTVRGR